MVLAALAEKDEVAELTFSDLRRVFGDGEQLARDNQPLSASQWSSERMDH
jgi:hypothetical protein